MSRNRVYRSHESEENSSQSDSDSDSSCSRSKSNSKDYNINYDEIVEKKCTSARGKFYNSINIKCPIGPSGATGPAGPPGMSIMGPPGATGPAGESITGATGPVGLSFTGPTGPSGDIGLVGPTGPSGESITGASGLDGLSFTGPTGSPGGLVGFGYIYNTSEQTVESEDPIIFDSNSFVTGFIHTPPSPFIVIVNTGIYKIEFSVLGNIPNQFSVFVNDIPVPSSVYASSIGTQQNNGMALLSLNLGDVVTIVNHSTGLSVSLLTMIGGTQSNVNASVFIERIR